MKRRISGLTIVFLIFLSAIFPVLGQDISGEVSKPKIEINLNDHTRFQIEYKPEIIENWDKTEIGDKQIWTGIKQEVNYYQLSKTEQWRIAYELEVILKEKPGSNVFTFKIDSKNLEYYYQPPLYEEIFPKDYTVNDTHAIDEKGILSNYRPENVVNSYAVYDSTTDRKIMHIFRPKIIDAKLNETWGNLSIIENDLTITIPQTFLDKAKYPVIIDPTFGYTTIGGTADSTMWANRKFAFRFENIVGNGNVTLLSFYGKSTSATANMMAAIYESNSSDLPTDLIGVSNVVSVTTDLQWWNFTINQEVDLSKDYWFAFLRAPGGNQFTSYYDAGGVQNWIWETDLYADGFSDPFLDGNYDSLQWRFGSAFATVELISLPSKYGEDETSLGQFVDTFEDSNNVSVTVNVIRNSTLNAMELNETDLNPIFINASAYTEVDEDGDLTVIDTEIDFVSMREDANTYVYRDFGAGNLDNFEYELIINMTDTEAGDASSPIQFGILTMANAFGKIDSYDATYLTLYVSQHNSVDDIFRMGIRDRKAGANIVSITMATIFNMSEPYYITYNRTGVDLGVFVFRDSARTNLIDSATGAGWGDNYRYLHLLANKGQPGDPADHMTGTLSFYWNGTVTEGEGYFTTVDYLLDPYASGSGLAVLVDTSIPANTDIQFQISDDNISWTDHEGTGGASDNLTGGFQSIDLRDLNYSVNIYFRGNLSTSDPAVTPLFNQIRLITMIGNVSAPIIQNITGAWIEYNASAIGATVGTVDAGNLASTFFIDGDTFDVSEVVGVPGMVVSVNFSGVDPLASCLWLNTYYSYDGNLNHDFDIEIWNFDTSSWVEDSHLVDTVGFEWANATIYALRIPLEYISGGEVRVRFDHEAAGNINHDLFIDYVRLQAFVPSAAATEEAFEFFWIVIGIALMLIGIIISKMWFDQENS